MCGIAAVIGKVGNKEEKLKISLSKITHRGEHHYEYKTFDGIALGANRLGITDEPLGVQPQHDETGEICAVLNGEIFNFLILRNELQGLEHTFRTKNDTEVLAHLWREYGKAMVTKLDSEMFAFIVYDKKQDEIFAARDRIGVKPLYYAYGEDNTLFFASEIKALVCLKEVREVHEFPPGHYFYQGRFVAYADLQTHESDYLNEDVLEEAIVEAIAKRVQTELPVAVFLSGGVDSSLVMEVATRFHNNVTALILGGSNSSDYINALRLCQEKHWKYTIIEPNISYEKELPDIVYFVESYDPNIVRHSFANHVISKLAHDLGFKIVLTGEGADEIFAGYNEFFDLEPEHINRGCRMLLDSMSWGHLMRIDKLAMRHTVETRCPFFDQQLVDIAMSLDGSFKVGEYNGKRFTKLLLRKIALKYLPEQTAFREKVAFANGAGMNVGLNYKKSDGVLSKIAADAVTDMKLAELQRDFSEYKLETKEEAMLFDLYRSFDYDKFVEGRERLIVKDTLLTI